MPPSPHVESEGRGEDAFQDIPTNIVGVFPLIPSIQKDWRFSANFESQRSQPVSESGEVQDGNSIVSILKDLQQDGIPGPEGCLSSCSNPRLSSMVPGVSVEGLTESSPHLPMEHLTVWPGLCLPTGRAYRPTGPKVAFTCTRPYFCNTYLALHRVEMEEAEVSGIFPWWPRRGCFLLVLRLFVDLLAFLLELASRLITTQR